MIGLVFFFSCTIPKQNSEASKPNGPDETFLSSKKTLLKEFQLSAEEKKMIEIADKKIINNFNCESMCCYAIAFSVFDNNHNTALQDVILEYKNVITDEGGGWNAGAPAMFIAPCNGLYYFSISFEKDAYYLNGTTDDVMIFLTKVPFGSTVGTYIGYAWSGEGDGMRGTGAYDVVLRLKVGDKVYTKVHSDGGLTRHLYYYNFTGFSIGK
jgi:hypothetical protein